MSETAPTPMRLMLIINPISGTRSKRGLAERIEARLAHEGFEVETRLTTCAGDATRLAREAVDHSFDGVLACGGDGTINETARALCHTPVALGILPAGSGNGLARHIDIPIHPIKALDIIAKRNIRRCDYGTVNDRPFFCTFGIGFDAAVADRFAHQSRRGLITYLKSALSEFIHYTPERYTIEVEGNVITDEAFIIAVCNASQYGNNAYIAPAASITDGLLDITIVHRGNLLDTATMGFNLLTGTLNRNTRITTMQVPSLVIHRNSEGPAHIDGEPLTLGTSLDARCHPAAISMFTPPDKAPFRPFITPARSTMRSIGISLSNLFQRR